MNFVVDHVEKANTRTGNINAPKRGQNFKFRFRMYHSEKSGDDSRFYISDKVWEKLSLDTKGLKEITLRESKTSPVLKVWMEVVENDKAVILRKTSKNNEQGKKKGRNFKSSVLESHLAEIGLVSLDKESMQGKNQLLDLVPVDEATLASAGLSGRTIFEIVKDVEGQKEEDAAPSTEAADAEVNAPAAVAEDDESL